MPPDENEPKTELVEDKRPPVLVPMYQRTRADHVSALVRAKDAHVRTDPLVKTVADKSPPKDILDGVLLELAKEAAALGFAIREVDKTGRDSSKLSRSRADVLGKIAVIAVDRNRMGTDELDLRSSKVQLLFNLWITNLSKVARDTMTREQADLFFSKLTAAMAGWENEAESNLKGVLCPLRTSDLTPRPWRLCSPKQGVTWCNPRTLTFPLPTPRDAQLPPESSTS